ncbi:DUF805 domain-containing protein [Massilia aquatica]|uniref:DUF805 domain-containing protein n=1 Tax=Massilia aquatica TaxID=2609000 RepID=UPI001420625D
MSEAAAAPACYRPLPWQWRGRIGRVRFAAYAFPVFAVYLLLLYWARMSDGGQALPDRVAQFAPLVLMVLLSILPVTRRLHDMRLPSRMALVLLAPLLIAPDAVLVLLYGVLACYPGERDSNRFGPPPCPNSGWTVGAACLWLVFPLAAAWLAYRIASSPPLPPLPPKHGAHHIPAAPAGQP